MYVDVRESLCYISAPMLNAGIPNNAPKQDVMLTNVLPSNFVDKKKPLRTYRYARSVAQMCMYEDIQMQATINESDKTQ